MTGAIKRELASNLQNVKGQALMERPVTIQKFVMDLLLGVVQPNFQVIQKMLTKFFNGVNNYFLPLLVLTVMQPIVTLVH